MSIQFYSKKWGELPLSNKLSSATQQLYFPGADVFLSKPYQNASCYFIQQIKVKYFTIRYCCFYSSERDWITIAGDSPSITFRIGYNHSHQVITKDLGKQLFHERSYNIFFDPDPSPEYPTEVDQSFIFLDLLFEKEYAWYLEHYFPETEQLLTNAFKKTAGKLSLQNGVAPIDIWRWQEELLDWCYFDDRKENVGLIIGNKLVESCLKVPKASLEQVGTALTIDEANRISDAAEIILSSKETVPVPVLAKKLGLSAHKLNTGFKEIFGYPASKHKFEDKMMNALRMLDCKGMGLEEIASTLGYTQVETFSNDFKKRFGSEPLPLDKNKKQGQPR